LNKEGARNKATRKPRCKVPDETPLFFPSASPLASQSNISALNEGLTYRVHVVLMDFLMLIVTFQDIPQAIHVPVQDSLITNLN